MSLRRGLAAALAAAALLAPLTLVAAPAATAATGDDRAVVDNWYADFLGRDASADPGSQYWVDQLKVRAPGDLLWSITHSREYVEDEVTDIYNGYLDRAPDSGANYWVEGATAQRFPIEWAEQNVLASAEYARHHYADTLGESNVATWWYRDVLGREASAGEAAYWAGRSARIGRLGALRELWYSDEAVRGRINEHYNYLLSRDADLPGLNYWYPKEVESDINVQVLLAASQEYRSGAYDKPYIR